MPFLLSKYHYNTTTIKAMLMRFICLNGRCTMIMETSANILRKGESVVEDHSAVVSVVVPVYNAGAYLEMTLDSIEGQSLECIEVLCIDDCSTDDSLAVLRERAARDSRYLVICHDENMGAGAAINTGIGAASGKYVQIVGNDDLLVPNAIEMLVNFCDDNNLDLCMYGVEVFGETDADASLAARAESQRKYHEVSHSYPACSGVDLLKLMTAYDEYRMTNSPMLVRRDLLEQCAPCNIEGVRHEDMFYTYKLLLNARRCTLIPDRYYRYRIREGSQEDGKIKNPHSVAEIESLLVSACRMLRETPQQLLEDPTFSNVVDQRINAYITRCTKWFESLDGPSREDLKSSAFEEVRFLYPAMQRSFDLANSNSFKLGRLLSAVPRALKRLLRNLIGCKH